MSSNTQFNTIFQGVSPKPIRDAMASFAHDNKFDKIIMPCVGRFAGAEAIIRAGVAPSKIITGDISLFSSVLGYYFANKNLSALKITSDFDFITHGSPPEFYAASVLYGIKVCQAKDNTYYAAQLKEALLKNPQARIQALANSLKELKTAMGGGYKLPAYRHERYAGCLDRQRKRLHYTLTASLRRKRICENV